MKFKGEGIRATKELFLMNPTSQEDRSPSLLLNGIITTVPWRSRQEYELLWDTLNLPVAVEKCDLRHSVIKSDDICLANLKMARFTFDQQYPDGPKGVVNVGWAPARKTASKGDAIGKTSTSRASAVSRNTRSSLTEKLHQCYLVLVELQEDFVMN
jgi:hypothetical protein